MKILIILIILSICVAIHEFGHALAMYKNNIKIKEGAIGFGFPFSKKLADIKFTLKPPKTVQNQKVYIVVGTHVLINDKNWNSEKGTKVR